MSKYLSLFISCMMAIANGYAQTDTLGIDPPVDDEDFSMYENFDFADEGAKRYCTPKVFDQSPAKLISAGYDYQGAFDIDYGEWKAGDKVWAPNSGSINGGGGLRLNANIPVISKTNVVFQTGFNYARTAFYSNETEVVNPLHSTLLQNGLTTVGLNATLFKPLSAEAFMIGQGSADLNGDFYSDQFTPLQYTRYSAAVIYGKKVNDRKMIGFGLSRTYRVGEINYIPVMLLNWTAPNRKWGVEMLAPARVHVRKTLSARNILLFGYELEGNSYHILNNNDSTWNNFELRRSELRIRAVWETSLYQFIWMSLQVGYRHGYSFNVDKFDNDKEFFRGFFGDQPYAQENQMNGTWYAQVSINLVSP
jgi:hypothetical protein